MSEAKECVGGRIVQMMHDPPASARSALRTLMMREPRHTHFAKAGGRPRTDRTVTGRRPQAYYADEPRPCLVLSSNLIHCGNEFRNSVPVRTLGL